jgi:hypothetical protein
MSSSDAENTATVVKQDAHRVAAEETALEDAVIDISLHQGTLKETATFYLRRGWHEERGISDIFETF